MEEGARVEELQVQPCRARLDWLATASWEGGHSAEADPGRLHALDVLLRFRHQAR